MLKAAMDTHDLIELFSFSMSPLELIVRGTVMYWFLFAIFRFVLRRDIGAIGIADVLVLVIIADASQNAMAGEYKTVADGMVLVCTLVGWNYAIDWAAFRSERLRALLEPPPLLLIRRGRIVHRNLRQEFLNVSDLMSELRKQGIDDVRQVRKAFMEGDGHFSILLEQGRPTLPLQQPSKDVAH